VLFEIREVHPASTNPGNSTSRTLGCLPVTLRVPVSASRKTEHCGPGGAIVAACGLALLLTPLSIRAVAAAAEAEARGRDDDDSASSLKKLSIAELLDIEVTSVSKTAESLSDAAAAVYVITRDDILRSGSQPNPAGTHRGRNGAQFPRRGALAVLSRQAMRSTQRNLTRPPCLDTARPRSSRVSPSELHRRRSA